jgi:hypothetical protein
MQTYIECLECKNRIDNEDNTWSCKKYPGEVYNDTNAPKYLFESFRGTGYPDYISCDCEDIDWIEHED